MLIRDTYRGFRRVLIVSVIHQRKAEVWGSGQIVSCYCDSASKTRLTPT